MNSEVNLADCSPSVAPVQLQPGDLLPRVVFRSESDEPFDLGLDDVAGSPLVLLLYPNWKMAIAHDTLRAIGAVHHDLVKLGARVFAVTPATAQANVDIKAQLNLPFEFLSDPERAFLRAVPGSASESLAQGAVTALVIRSNAHVMRILDSLTNSAPLLEAVQEEAQRRRPAAIAMHPPVLIVPDVLSPKDCQRLITTFTMEGNVWVERGKQVGIKFDYKMRNPDYGRQDRVDHVIHSETLDDFLTMRLRSRLLPEIKKAFQTHVVPIENYRIGRYEGKRGGYRHGHRDNPRPEVAHRRFAMSINLNSEDFEGGGLRFPEYGEQIYRPDTGAAIVFSCSLLHEALEVKKGCRYVLVTFLGDATRKISTVP